MSKLTSDQINALNEESKELSIKAIALMIAKALTKIARAQKLTYQHRYGSEFWKDEKSKGK